MKSKKSLLICVLTAGVFSSFLPPVQSQNLTYTRSVLRELCSPALYGRGYVNHGDRLAAEYIASQFGLWKVKPLGESYFQPLTMKINSQNKADILFDGEKLKGGVDYLVEATTPPMKGTFPVVKIDAKTMKRTGQFTHLVMDNKNPFYLLDSSGLNNPELYQFVRGLLESDLIPKAGIMEVTHRVPFGVPRKNFNSYARIQTTGKTLPVDLKEVYVDFENTFYPEYPTQNVVGQVKGKTDEWIVFTAHYDGMGMYGDVLFPGASDNGSGTAMVIDLARHFATGPKPYYSIAFVLCAGEEAGLHGSTFFVNNPLVPLEKIRMNINLDMVGTGQDGCTLFNATTWPRETGKILAMNEEKSYLKEIRPVGPAANSDHHPFYLKGVPALFFITGGASGGGHTALDTEEALPLFAYEKLFRLITDFIAILPTLPEPVKYPLTDYHVHLKGDFTLEKALERSKQTGIQYGIAINCGLGFPVQDDDAALAFLDTMRQYPFKLAMQAEGREWVNMFSKRVIKKFDYVFTDAMTYTNEHGKRVRLWMNDEVEINDSQLFMDDLVSRIVQIISAEPINIYVNPTFLPEVIAKDYDQLWTPERMQKVIDAAVKHKVAIEINNRYRLPSEAFIKLAKEKGVKFAFGTNNADSMLGDLDYCKEMIVKCGLTASDMWGVERR